MLNGGFIFEGDALVGVIDNYTVLISYEWLPHTCVKIEVLFDPRYLQRFYTPQELRDIYKCVVINKWYQQLPTFITPFSIFHQNGYYQWGKLVSAQEVLKEAEKLVWTLEREGLKPVGLQEKLRLEEQWQNGITHV